MRRAMLVMAWVSVGAVVVGFFLPWAMIDVHEPSLVKQLRTATPLHETLGGFTKDVGRIAVKIRRGAETITGDLPSLSDIPKQVSGFQVPQVANQEHAQVAMALIELFTQQRQHLGGKSYLVYLLPGLALVCGLLVTFLGARLPVTMSVGILCAAIAGFGFWKLLTTNMQTLFVAITIGRGLWLSLWGYAGLALAAVGFSVFRPKRV